MGLSSSTAICPDHGAEALGNGRKEGLPARRGAAGREGEIEKGDERGRNGQEAAKQEKASGGGNGSGIRDIQLSTSQSADDAEVIGVVAVGLDPGVERRTGGEATQNHHQEQNERGRNRFRRPAKT